MLFESISPFFMMSHSYVIDFTLVSRRDSSVKASRFQRKRVAI